MYPMSLTQSNLLLCHHWSSCEGINTTLGKSQVIQIHLLEAGMAEAFLVVWCEPALMGSK